MTTEAGPGRPPVDISALTDEVQATSGFVDQVFAEVGKVVVGQRDMIERVMIGLLTGGHCLIEGVPGLAKTLTVKTLSQTLNASFSRVQFTPDLLPADITGTIIYNMHTGQFTQKRGPLFANLVLADEVNRAPAKVQSALLEAMQERQITIGDSTHMLPDPFLVLATQNPIEQEGTFPLPEAQLDRFTMRLTLGYPDARQEATMLAEHAAGEPLDALRAVTTAAEIEASIAAVRAVFVEESLHRYVVAILTHTRSDTRLSLGASPRAGIALLRVAKAHAVVEGRDYVSPGDVKAVAEDVLSHRVILAPEARTAGIDAADSIREALERTAIPV